MSMKLLKSVISISAAVSLTLGMTSIANAKPDLCQKVFGVMVSPQTKTACADCHVGKPDLRPSYQMGACERVAAGNPGGGNGNGGGNGGGIPNPGGRIPGGGNGNGGGMPGGGNGNGNGGGIPGGGNGNGNGGGMPGDGGDGGGDDD